MYVISIILIVGTMHIWMDFHCVPKVFIYYC